MSCRDCSNLQTGIDVNQAFIYDEYIWKTSISPGLTELYENTRQDLVSRFFPVTKGFSVELGSNDGTFSGFLKAHGMKVLGVDPAREIAAHASAKGVETIVDFFDLSLRIGCARSEATRI